jgi:hypothetical protein
MTQPASHFVPHAQSNVVKPGLTVVCPELADIVPLQERALVGQEAIQKHVVVGGGSSNVAAIGGDGHPASGYTTPYRCNIHTQEWFKD